jgi:hypothetical protein
MVRRGNQCPLDGSRLVYLSGSYGAKGLDLSVCYCPRCDVAVVFLTRHLSASPPAVLRWHRQGEQLELRAEDRPRWQELPRQLRECGESNVRHHVALFLRRRHSEGLACPIDGCRVPVVYRWRDGRGPGWRMAWCRWCGMGFLFAFDPDYGWEHRANVVWDDSRQRYQIREQHATDGEHEISPHLVGELPPLSKLWPGG